MVAALAAMTEQEFKPQDVNIYRPYPDDIPWELLLLADPDESRIYEYADADYMRVAKLEDESIGVYVVRALSPTVYELCNLAVAPAWRRRGLGRWLLGHAIGIAESKGGREIVVSIPVPGGGHAPPPSAGWRGLFERTGFVAGDRELRLVLTPE